MGNQLKIATLTPTMQNREKFLERCKRIVKRQDYPNIQHIIIPREGSIGTKLNLAIKSSSADIFVRFDDDDWFAKDYVSVCVEKLKECDCTGLSSAYFTDGLNAWLWEWKGGQPLVCGSGMAFWRKAWENNHFKDTSHGEDTIFCANAGIIKPHGYLDGFIATIHGENTSSHNSLKAMKMVNLNLLPMGVIPLSGQAFQ